MQNSIIKIFLAFSALSFVTSTVLEAKVSDQERDALIKLYDATNGDDWKKNDNWKDGDPCENDWKFVSCNDENTEIRSLLIYKNNLNGELPAELGNLKYLKYLNLAYNREIKGEIPKELGNLDNLKYLNLSVNKIEGEIPKELGNLDNLEILYLFLNKLKGEIPKELGNLNHLISLKLWQNRLKGEIPKELGNLNNLKCLYLAANILKGEIPKELTNLNALKSLILNYNSLEGTILKEFNNLENLELLNLSGNKLTGEIPVELGDIKTLKYLYLNRNNLEGIIPKELGNLTNLKYLSLYLDNLRNEIPKELGSLENLEYLYLQENKLSKEIPKELGDLNNLKYLYLCRNQLEGKIPKELGNLEKLTNLYFFKNKLEGELPKELGNIDSLRYISLGENKLSGKIPKELGNLKNLKHLHIYNNNLSGKVPLELQDMDKIQSIGIGHNSLFTDDLDFDNWLDNKGNNWSKTQTIAVKDVTTSDVTAESIQLNWSTIEFDEEDNKYRDGGYEIYIKESDDSYKAYATTDEKTDTHIVIKNLKAETDYCFKIQTFTKYKYSSENNVTSYMSESSCTTTKEDEHIEVSIDNIDIIEDDTPTFRGKSKRVDGDLILILNDIEYSITPEENGDWEFTLPDSDALDDDKYIVTIQGDDADGNKAKDEDKFEIDADKPEVTIDDIDTIEDNTPTFNGHAIYTDGDLIFSVNNKNYSISLMNNGDWSFTLPDDDELDDGNYKAQIKGTDVAKNSAEANDDFKVESKPEINIDDVKTTDDHTPTFTGTSKRVDGDLTLSVNDKDYSVKPEKNGDWEFTIPDMDMLRDGDYRTDVEGSSRNGKTAESYDEFNIKTIIGNENNCQNNEVFNEETDSCELQL